MDKHELLSGLIQNQDNHLKVVSELIGKINAENQFMEIFPEENLEESDEQRDTLAGKRGPLPQGVKPINKDNDWFVTSIRFSASQMEDVDNFLYENRLRSSTDSIFLLLKLGIQQYRHNPDKARKDLGL